MDTDCLQLTVPIDEAVADFHCQATIHAGTQSKPYGEEIRLFVKNQAYPQ
ncbi:hypothetical protein [Sporolactobacillus terrae]|nr:hypothetical protein [Sporolactobacillus terrae]